MTTQAERRRVLPSQRVLVGVLLLGVLFSSVYPMRRYIAVRDNLERLRSQEAAVDRQAVELARERDLLTTDAEVERLARERLGYVRPGEVPFVVADPPSKAAGPGRLDQRPADQTRRDSPLLRRWVTALTQSARMRP